jgi:myosin heavy subunit
LERARVTGFVQGECNYHIFYQLIMGLTTDTPESQSPSSSSSSSSSSNFDCKALRARLGLELSSSSQSDVGKAVSSFNYLNHRAPVTVKSQKQPSSQTVASASGGVSVYKSLRSASRDRSDFAKVVDALASVGIAEKERSDIFAILGAILHFGNVAIGQATASDSDDAFVDGTANAQNALKHAAALVGVDADALTKALCEKTMKVAGEVVTKKLNVGDARRTRDAAAKQLYSYLFDYIVLRINQDLNPRMTKPSGE